MPWEEGGGGRMESTYLVHSITMTYLALSPSSPPHIEHTVAVIPVCVLPFNLVNKPPFPTNILNNDTKSFSSCVYRPLLFSFNFPLPHK